MKLYFFPALAPIASVIPSVLAAVAALSAAWHTRRGRLKYAVALGLCAIGLATYALRKPRPSLPLLGQVESLPVKAPTGAWKQFVPRAPLSGLARWTSPQDELLLYGTRQRTLDALRVRDGSLAFTLQLAEPVCAEPLVIGAGASGDLAVVTEGVHDSRRSRVVAVSLPSGTPVWSRAFDGHIESQPRVSRNGETLYLCVGDGGAAAISTRDGSLLWQSRVGHCDSTPALGERGEIHVLAQRDSARSRFVSLESESGQELDSFELPGQPWGTIERHLATGYWLVTTGFGRLIESLESGEQGWAHALDLVSRRVVWSRELGGMPLLRAAVSVSPPDRMMIALKRGAVLALDGASGAIRWQTTLSSPVLAELRLSQGKLWVTSYDGTLYELEPASGEIQRRWQIEQRSTSAPLATDDSIYWAARSAIGRESR